MSPSPPHTDIPPTSPDLSSPSGRRVVFANDLPMAEMSRSPHPLCDIEPRPSAGFHSVHHRGFKVAKEIQIRPMHILSICWRTASPASKCVNLLWPLVPTAITLQYTRPDDLHLLVFILNYLAMIPCANLIGTASHESTRKLPRVLGHLVEVTLASTPEMILLLVLLQKKQYYVIQAAVLGSILASLLLCLGVCFFCGGLIYSEQTFNGAVSELGSDLLLTAYVLSPYFLSPAMYTSLTFHSGMGLMIPGAFHATHLEQTPASGHVLLISRITSIFLMIAYFVYVYFQMRSHHNLYEVLLKHEEEIISTQAPHKEEKLCSAECLVSLVIGLTLVTILAINLVEGIPFIVEERGVSESFLGLILVPIVEKAAEHIGTVEDACRNHMTSAMFHVLGSAIQTALFNIPLVVLIGWAIGRDLDLEFELFNMIVLVLSILVVGSFTRDQKCNYLEGSLCLIVYVLIAVGSYFD